MPETITLSYLQDYIKDKDFKPDLKHAYFLKLVEEIGELSEVLRKDKRMINSNIKDTVEEELYDVLYYLLALANVYEVDLEEAFILKEKVNNKKYNRMM
ncbi:MazG nucleotide pyrophosphohydrolase domain-containing protein [Halanaerobiaceae bacterium ANBcell28]